MTETPDFQPIEEPIGPFITFIPTASISVGIKDNEKAETLTLIEFITTQSTDSGSCAAFASVRGPSTSFKFVGKG